MRILLVIGSLVALVGLIAIGAAVVGEGDLAPNLVLGGIMFVLGSVLALVGRGVTASLHTLELQITELESRGVRRTGRVRDVVAMSFARGGSQNLLRIELPEVDGVEHWITCQLVEDGERARARIGQEIVVVHHPEDPMVRAIEGHRPDGRPVRVPPT